MVESYITGSQGFLGSHLKERLNNAVSIPHQQIPFTKLDNFQNFFFLSSYGNLAHQQESSEIIKANVSDLIYILDQIDAKRGFNSFVYTSSSSVRLKVQTMYSRCKKASEEILLSYMEKENLPICIVRPFSVTGVGEQKEHLIPTLIRSCLTGERVNFVPKPTHDFIDVEDVAEGILNLSKHKAHGIFELGTGKQYSNQQVLEIVESKTGKKANINLVPSLRDYDNEEWVSNNYKARMYGWLPQKSLDQSIEEMVKEAKRELVG